MDSQFSIIQWRGQEQELGTVGRIAHTVNRPRAMNISTQLIFSTGCVQDLSLGSSATYSGQVF